MGQLCKSHFKPDRTDVDLAGAEAALLRHKELQLICEYMEAASAISERELANLIRANRK